MIARAYSKTRAGKAWHIIARVNRDGRDVSRCGLTLGLEWRAELPLNEPSCESCMRLVVHDAEGKR